MAYAVIQDVPGNVAIYHQVKEALGDEPSGLIARIVTVIPGGLRHLQVWESRQAWQQYQDEHINPAVTAVLARLGIEPDPDDVRIEEPELVDVVARAVGSDARTAAQQ